MLLIRLIHSDYRRYVAQGNPHFFSIILACQGIWASVVYRISHSLVSSTRVPIVKRCFRIIAAIASKLMQIITGIALAYDSEIGEGLHILHFGNIIVGSKVKMGSNCTISQGVTLGGGGHGLGWGVPTIGNRVYIGPNAVVFGKITIGNDVMIGAGCVVSRSIRDRAVVIGNPAQIVWFEGSFERIRYDGMDSDEERCASMLAKKSRIRRMENGRPDPEPPTSFV